MLFFSFLHCFYLLGLGIPQVKHVHEQVCTFTWPLCLDQTFGKLEASQPQDGLEGCETADPSWCISLHYRLTTVNSTCVFPVYLAQLSLGYGPFSAPLILLLSTWYNKHLFLSPLSVQMALLSLFSVCEANFTRLARPKVMLY